MEWPTQAIRSIEPDVKVGIVLNLTPVEAYTDDKYQKMAAERAWNATSAWFLDPLFKGCYPPGALKDLAADAPVVQPNDFALISQKLDYLGVNYYTRTVIGPQGEMKKCRVPSIRKWLGSGARSPWPHARKNE